MTPPPPGKEVSPAGRGRSGPGAAPVAPEEAARAPWPGAGPASVPPRPGAGQHPFAPVTVAFPDGRAAILDSRGQWHVRELAWDGRRARETGGQPALTRPARARYEAWQDEAVNVP